jgi:hypothetical protein
MTERPQLTITTAARRIARALNGQRRAGFRLAFDAEGKCVGQEFDPDGRREDYMHLPPWRGAAFWAPTYQEAGVPGAPLHHYTYAEIQWGLEDHDRPWDWA